MAERAITERGASRAGIMSMRLLLRRLGGSVLVVVLASIMVSLMVHLIPGDAASAVAGDNASAEQIEATRERLGLDQPIWIQYLNWMGGVLRGDFGESLISNRPVTTMIRQVLPATLSITLAAVVIAVVIGVTLGGIAGVRRGVTDRITSLGASLGIAMPSFWVGMLLVTFFALEFNLFPVLDYTPLTEDPVGWLHHITLPALALGLGMSAEVARQTRGGVVDVMAQPYIRTARAKGTPGGRLFARHVVRNAAIPVITVLGLQIGRLLGGVIIIEQVFAINGLGTMAIRAVTDRDFPVIQAYVLLTTVIVVSINLLVDLSYGWINPRVRSEE
jgi:peptide/nickel transport system permease protein